jgi:hypothetical protein
MPDSITAAVIAGGVSLVTAFVTFFVTWLNTQRQLKNKFQDRLHEVRLKEYPRAFDLTDCLGKRVTDDPSELPALYCQLGSQLREWKAGTAALVLSNDALNEYWEVVSALKGNPARGDRYSDQQIERIWNARCRFRDSLRIDIGLESEQRNQRNWSSNSESGKKKK